MIKIIDENFDIKKNNPLDFKLCEHNHTFNTLIAFLEESPDEDFPVKKECLCRGLYYELIKPLYTSE